MFNINLLKYEIISSYAVLIKAFWLKQIKKILGKIKL